MAFARSVQKAAKINKLKELLREEKEYSINFASGTKPKISSRLKLRHAKLRFRRKLGTLFKKIFPITEGTKVNMFFYKLRKDGSCENFTFKSLVGFISGFFLTYLFFMIFVFQLNLKFGTATVMCSVIGGILTIGLAFSYKVRCVVLLLLPTCFSKRGRQALLAYAFILSLTGPAKNTLNNMGILNESLACGQEQLKEALKQIIDAIKKPFYAIKDALKTVVRTVKNIVKKIKEILLTIKRIILSIVKVIKGVFQFLAKIFSICNKEVGTPFERCSRAFEDAISDCNAKLGPYFNWLCSITYLVQGVCYIVKILDFICILVDFVSNSVVGVIIRKVKNFVRHIKTMFYVRLRFSHSFHFETNQSKTIMDVTAGIATEFKNRTQRLTQIFDIMSCAASIFFVLAVIKVIYYRHKFLTSETFDNRYVTQDFRNLDMRRAQMETETVLPLNHRERKKYVSSTSIRLIDSEKKKLSKAAMTVFVATIKMTVYILIDYALFWTLKMIRYHARFQSKVKAPNTPTLHITGNGFIAKLLRSVVTAFQPVGVQIEIDTIPCLPDPIPPDYDRYIQIASCIVLCWILAILEPYGLRMRHCVMCYYHPLRAKERAIWLFNHIMSARRSFLKFARRQLRRKVMGDNNIGKGSFKQFIVSHLIDRCPFLKSFIKVKKVETCLLCGEMLQSEPSTRVRCQTPGCPGMYCQLCYNDLKNVCTICQDPIEYGDYSDIDEEKDSSDDNATTQIKDTKPKEKIKHRKIDLKKDFTDSEDGSSTSSGFSESYQTSDRKSTLDLMAYSTPSGDVEKQDVPTYASMQAFIEPESEGSASTAHLSKSSRSGRRSRGRKRSKEKSKHSKRSSKRRSSRSSNRSNKRNRRNSSRSKVVSDGDSQDILELGMYPLRDKPQEKETEVGDQKRVKVKKRKEKSKFRSLAISEETERSTSAVDSADSSVEHSESTKLIRTTSTADSTDLSSASDTSIISELKPLKRKKLARKGANREHISQKSTNQSKNLKSTVSTSEQKTSTKLTKKSSKSSSKTTRKLSSFFKRSKTKYSEMYTTGDSSVSSTGTSESENLSESKRKLIERSSDSSLLTELQERKKFGKSSTDASSSDELLPKIQHPKKKLFGKSRKKETKSNKSTQFSNAVSTGTQKSEGKLQKHHLSIPLITKPPPFPPFLESSPQSKPVDEDNTLPTRKNSRRSVIKIEKKVKEHLRGGEDIPTDKIKKFLTGPKTFRLPSGQPKTFSPMKSLSGVISELKNVFGEDVSEVKKKEKKIIDNVEELPLPPIPTGLSMNQESVRTLDLIPEKNRTIFKVKADGDYRLSQKVATGLSNISPTTMKVIENQQQKILRVEQEIKTPIFQCRENFNMPTVRERIRAYEEAFGTEQFLGSPSSTVSTTDLRRNENPQFDIYFTPQHIRERSRHQVPRLNLISDREGSCITSRVFQFTSPDKMVDHCRCQCDLPRRVRYEIHNEKESPVKYKCECKRRPQ